MFFKKAFAIFAIAVFAVTTALVTQPASAGPDDIPTTTTTITVSTSSQLSSALSSASQNTTIRLANGTYSGTFSISKTATAVAPIVIRAANVGGAVFASGSSLTVNNSAYITVADLKFLSGASTVMKLAGSNNSRVTGVTFDRGSQSPSTSKWLLINGASHHNRVDHNTFANKTDLSNYLTLDGANNKISQYDRIDHNTFKNIGPHAENDKEAVRLGSSSMSMSSGFTTFENNTFEDCNGDPEFLSVKASDMTIRYNVAKRSQGSLVLRHGNRNQVYANVILGENIAGTGGIRMYGVDHKVFNNYVANTKGTSYEAALTIDGGDALPGDSLSKHHRVDNAQVVFNTLVDNATGIVIGEHYKHAPVNLTVRNNLLADSASVVIKKTPTGTSTIASNTVGTKSAVGLVYTNGFWKLTAGSSQINAATGTYTYVTTDMDGQTRTDPKDIGADEFG